MLSLFNRHCRCHILLFIANIRTCRMDAVKKDVARTNLNTLDVLCENMDEETLILLMKFEMTDLTGQDTQSIDGIFTFRDYSDGSLLANGLCNNITHAECLAGADGAIGALIRNTQQLSFIPHQNLPAINW